MYVAGAVKYERSELHQIFKIRICWEDLNARGFGNDIFLCDFSLPPGMIAANVVLFVAIK